MKWPRKKMIRAAALLIIMVIAACKPNPVEKLSKKWRPVDVQGEEISDDMRAAILQEGNMMEFTTGGLFINYSHIPRARKMTPEPIRLVQMEKF